MILDDEPLSCPFCDSSYLHHQQVTHYDRLEDNPDTTVTIVRAGLHVAHMMWPSETVRNPSSRRDGLVVQFWCEGCDNEPELYLLQHKGQTFLEWREKLR